MSQPRSEILEITGMRGWAALGVVLFHVCTVATLASSSASAFLVSYFPIPLGLRVGVDFFFVLSGFLLSRQFFSREVNLKNYYLRRIFRIWPLYFAGVLIPLLLWAMIGVRFTPLQIVANLTFTQNFFQTTFQTINVPFWTLAIEELFYVLLPLLAWLLTRRSWRIATIGLVAFAALWRVLTWPSWFLGDQFFGYVFNFLLGMLIAKGAFIVEPTKRNVALAGSTFLFLVAITGEDASSYLFPPVPLAYALIFASVLSMTMRSHPSSSLKGMFTNRVAVAAGRVSYSTYVWHWIILQVLFATTIWWLPAFLITMPVVSFLSWRLIEVPFDKFRHRLFPVSAPQVPVALGSSRTPLPSPAH